jgi:hypothetical protein
MMKLILKWGVWPVAGLVFALTATGIVGAPVEKQIAALAPVSITAKEMKTLSTYKEMMAMTHEHCHEEGHSWVFLGEAPDGTCIYRCRRCGLISE